MFELLNIKSLFEAKNSILIFLSGLVDFRFPDQ